MGFWRCVHNVVTLGGAYRLDQAKERHAARQLVYEQMRQRLIAANSSLESTIKRLRNAFRNTKKQLRTAHTMLYPKCLGTMRMSNVGYTQKQSTSTGALAVRHSKNSLDLSSGQYTLLGISAGTSAAIVAWQGVQVVGIASTGTAIGGIYGAAASNAGWASFGGGSLATGGGGMALGHLVLPGIGVLVAVGVSAVSTHSKANEINRLSDDLDSATGKNTTSLTRIDSETAKLNHATRIFRAADATLTREIRISRRKLRRFGWISAFYRYVRFKTKGVYYTSEERHYVQRLERAVHQFMTAFGAC
jgi:hypothetical protein